MRRRGLRFVLCVTAVLIGGAAQGQTPPSQQLERNLPPAPTRQAPAIRFNQPDLQTSDDRTPLGANLRSIVIIGAKDRAPPKAKGSGVDVRRADPAFAPAIDARLSPYIGQPLSRKLIADIQIDAARVYRSAGRPFVSVTVPPQEVTGGVLYVRVFEFRLGKVSVTGADPDTATIVRNRVRLRSGEPVDSRALESDLDWLNRNPLVRVEAVFGPGRELAVTDLTLQVTQTKPVTLYGGYTNTGTRLTDRDRWFAGFIASPGLTGPVVSYQVTGSPDFWWDDGLFGHASNAGYQSQAARVAVPLWARTSIEFLGNYVRTNEAPNAFLFDTQTYEGVVLLRTAAPSIGPVSGDFIGGVENKRQTRVSFLSGIEIGSGEAEVFQAVLGWIGGWTDEFGTNTFDVRLKRNPGGVLSHNTGVDWALITGGRVTDIESTFGTLFYNRVTPFFLGTSIGTDVIALFADQALPDTERLALGGLYAVRGYVIEDGTVDRAVIVRNSLYLPAMSFLPQRNGASDRFVPFAFFDAGHGRDVFSGRGTNLTSLGVGFDDTYGTWLRSNVTLGYALRDGQDTQSGDWRLQGRVVISY